MRSLLNEQNGYLNHFDVILKPNIQPMVMSVEPQPIWGLPIVIKDVHRWW
jgi:hypothetical protein